MSEDTLRDRIRNKSIHKKLKVGLITDKMRENRCR